MNSVTTTRGTITTIGHARPFIDEDNRSKDELYGWAFDGVAHPATVASATGVGAGGWRTTELSVIRDMANVFGEANALAFTRGVQDGRHRELSAALGRPR